MSGRRKPKMKRQILEVPIKVEIPIKVETPTDQDNCMKDNDDDSDSERLHLVTSEEKSTTNAQEQPDDDRDPLSLDPPEDVVLTTLIQLPSEPLSGEKCYRPFRKQIRLGENASITYTISEVSRETSAEASAAAQKDHPLIVLKALSAVSKELNQPKTKELNCAICPYTTNRSNNLARHMHTMHSLLTDPQECCSQLFATRYEHQEHNREFHASSKYPCHFPDCQKAQVVFERRGLLKRHVIGVHQRQKPFRCDYCAYMSSHKSNLDRHCRTQHGSYYVSPTLDPDECNITIEMDPSAVMKFKLDDDTFNLQPRVRVKQEDEAEEVSIKEEPLDIGEIKVKQEQPEDEEALVYPEVMIKSEPTDD